jgi:hypothetical protein
MHMMDAWKPRSYEDDDATLTLTSDDGHHPQKIQPTDKACRTMYRSSWEPAVGKELDSCIQELVENRSPDSVRVQAVFRYCPGNKDGLSFLDAAIHNGNFPVTLFALRCITSWCDAASEHSQGHESGCSSSGSSSGNGSSSGSGSGSETVTTKNRKILPANVSAVVEKVLVFAIKYAIVWMAEDLFWAVISAGYSIPVFPLSPHVTSIPPEAIPMLKNLVLPHQPLMALEYLEKRMGSLTPPLTKILFKHADKSDPRRLAKCMACILKGYMTMQTTIQCYDRYIKPLYGNIVVYLHALSGRELYNVLLASFEGILQRDRCRPCVFLNWINGIFLATESVWRKSCRAPNPLPSSRIF